MQGRGYVRERRACENISVNFGFIEELSRALASSVEKTALENKLCRTKDSGSAAAEASACIERVVFFFGNMTRPSSMVQTAAGVQPLR